MSLESRGRRSSLPPVVIGETRITLCGVEEESLEGKGGGEGEEFIASGNWRDKHNSLSRGVGADQPLTSRGRPSPLELPHFDEYYAHPYSPVPRTCCCALSRRPHWSFQSGLLHRRMDPLFF